MATASRDEEEVRKLNMQLQYFEQTADTLQQRLRMLEAGIADLAYANVSLESLEKEKENAEMLVPIGGSSYINVKLADPSKVIVGMGAGVSIQKTLPEAKTIVKERLDQLEKTRDQAQQQFTQIAERITQDRARMESLLSKLREGMQ